MSTERPRRPRRGATSPNYSGRATTDLKRSQRFQMALDEMRNSDVGPGNDYGGQRAAIYQRHGLDRVQWSKCYNAHVKKFPNAGLVAIEKQEAVVVTAPPQRRCTQAVRLRQKGEWGKAHAFVTTLVDGGKMAAQAIKEARAVGFTNVPSPRAIGRHVKAARGPGVEPKRRGRPPLIPRSVERQFAFKIKHFTAMGYSMDEGEVVAQMLHMIEGTGDDTDKTAEGFYNNSDHGGKRTRRW
jgi:hypothetical protein